MHYFPLAWPFLLVLAILFIVVVALLEFRILKYAYERMGVPPRHVLGVLLLSLLGSAINVPVAELPPEEMVADKVVDVNGVRYVVPVVREWPGTILAVNVGGAMIPTILSGYLLIKNRLYLRGILAVAVVVVVVHALAHPVRGVGISVPTLIPPVVAAGVALVFAWQQVPPLAYIAGSLGTLIGADLLNLDKIRGLGAPVASIGGAGTFDGVFLTGIIAVLISPVAGKQRLDQSVNEEEHSVRVISTESQRFPGE
jgi:uncharacterized membrane protein